MAKLTREQEVHYGVVGYGKGKPIKPRVKSKAKPRDLSNVQLEFKAYWLERDRLIYKTADKQTQIEILKRYNKYEQE